MKTYSLLGGGGALLKVDKLIVVNMTVCTYIIIVVTIINYLTSLLVINC